jgi:hypothetical protein
VIEEAIRKRRLNLACAVFCGYLFVIMGAVSWFEGGDLGGPSILGGGGRIPYAAGHPVSLVIALFGVLLAAGGILKMRRK